MATNELRFLEPEQMTAQPASDGKPAQIVVL